MSEKNILKSILNEADRIEAALLNLAGKQKLTSQLLDCEKILESVLSEFIKNTDKETLVVKAELFKTFDAEEAKKQLTRISHLSRQIKREIEEHLENDPVNKA